MFTPFKIKETSFPSFSITLDSSVLKMNEFTDEAGRNNSITIQNAIDNVSKNGGGHVILTSGFIAAAPIALKDNVDLHLNKGAYLKFTKNKIDYPLIITNYEGEYAIRTVSPISAVNVNNIAITGEGMIDGSGDLWRPVKKFKLTDIQWNALLKKSSYIIENKETIWFPSESSFNGVLKNIQGDDEEVLKEATPYWDFYRPVMISLRGCNTILLQGVIFTNSPAWNIHPFFCENLTVDSINVKNSYAAQNGDGLDVESSKNVVIKNSIFETGDDAICLKSGKNRKARLIKGPTENVHVHDCIVYQGHGGFVVGSEMSRGVNNVKVERCTFIGTDVGVRFKSALGRGGIVENIDINEIKMIDIKHEAVILTMAYVLNRLNNVEGAKMDDQDDIPTFRNIKMENLHFLGEETKIKIEPLNGYQNTITNIEINGETYNDAVLIK